MYGTKEKKKRAESLSHIEGIKTNKQTTQTTLQTTQKSGISNLFTTCWVKLNNIWNNVIRNLDTFVKCSYFIFMVECPNISIRILRNFEKWYHRLNSVWVCFFFTWRDDQFCRRGFAFISYVHNTACGGCDANLQSK